MKSNYKIIKEKNINHSTKYAKGFKTKLIKEVKNKLEFGSDKAENKEIRLNGLIVGVTTHQITPPFVMEVEHDFPFIKIQFEIEGYSQYIPKNTESIPIIIPQDHYNFFYLPKVNGTLTYTTDTRRSVEILVTEAYLKRAFKNIFHKVSGAFGEALINKTPFKMHNEASKIPSELLLIISDIISCTYQKEIKQVYLESKINEIFSYLFSEINSNGVEKKEAKPSEGEVKQIVKAEKILRNNLDKSFTIDDLAVETGINRNKLKRNFKSIYGKPIFTYLTDLRMEKAKKMLVENSMNISEIAYAVGYKNPQHFTNAFKKRFNYLPSDLRKKGLLANIPEVDYIKEL